MLGEEGPKARSTLRDGWREPVCVVVDWGEKKEGREVRKDDGSCVVRSWPN